MAALREFAEKQQIPYPLLSDQDSEVIRAYGILNEQVRPGDALLHGIPYPGVYVTDEEGVVVAKFFEDSYKKRESPELLIDAALGRIELSDDAPRAQARSEPGVRITAAVHGGAGTIRQGMRRALVVRFELDEGLHLYGEPVPEGMVPTSVHLEGPPGLVAEPPVFPPTEPLRLPGLDVELPTFGGSFDVVVPFYANGELASETRPLDATSVKLEVTVRHQACDDQVCLPPRTDTLSLEVELDVVDVPRLAMHAGHGQREGSYDASTHMRRLMLRKIRRHPVGFLRFIGQSLRLEIAARRRARG